MHGDSDGPLGGSSDVITVPCDSHGNIGIDSKFVCQFLKPVEVEGS